MTYEDVRRDKRLEGGHNFVYGYRWLADVHEAATDPGLSGAVLASLIWRTDNENGIQGHNAIRGDVRLRLCEVALTELGETAESVERLVGGPLRDAKCVFRR